MPRLSELIRSGNLWVAEPQRGYGEDAWETEDIASALTEVSYQAQAKSRVCIPFGIPVVDATLPEGGLPTGQIHEWLMPEARGILAPPATFILHLAKHARERLKRPMVVWIERDFWPSPHVVAAVLGQEALKDCLFLAPPSEDEKLWATTEALRSRVVALTIAPFQGLRLATTKKLALAAKEGGGVGCVLRPESARGALTAAASRWCVQPQPAEDVVQSWRLSIERWKGKQPLQREWVVGFSLEGECYWDSELKSQQALREGSLHADVASHEPSRMDVGGPSVDLTQAGREAGAPLEDVAVPDYGLVRAAS